LLGAVAGGDRDLRVDSVYGVPARPRNRNSAGSGSGIDPHPKYDSASWPSAGLGRRSLRTRRGFRVHTIDLQLSVWCEGVGSPSLFFGSANIGRRCATRSMVTGAAREPGRSHPGAAVRIGPTRPSGCANRSAWSRSVYQRFWLTIECTGRTRMTFPLQLEPSVVGESEHGGLHDSPGLSAHVFTRGASLASGVLPVGFCHLLCRVLSLSWHNPTLFAIIVGIILPKLRSAAPLRRSLGD
jgi:hypothetical protein